MPDVFVSEEVKQQPETLPEERKKPTGKHSDTMPFFASFCHNPSGVEFKNQEPDERISLFLRRHFIINLTWIGIGILFLMLPTILLLPFNFLQTLLAIIPLRFIIIFIAFYYLIITGYFFVNFITWFYNVGIITTKQIIDIDFTDLMYREVAKARIEDVIDVEFHQGGFLQSFYDFGNVFIQTEGIKPNFEFHSVPKPDKITDIILDLKGDKNV